MGVEEPTISSNIEERSIREVRGDLDITQDQLARRAGISKGFLSDVENNKRNISSENLLRIANVLGASVDYLLRGDVLESSTAATVELLEAHRSVIARRSNKELRKFSIDDWKRLYDAIKKVFG